jgi:hypothetical protein
MFTRDYLLRVIEQAADFIARITKSKREGHFKAGLRQVESAYDALLDMDRQLFEVANSGVLADLLGPPEKIRAIAGLVREEADLLRLSGDPINAQLKYKRAVELVLEARERGGEAPEDTQFIQQCVLHVKQQTLAPKYRNNVAWPTPSSPD